jgi:23S rRNA pseudouridine1911/1915/1917 synthase
VTEHHFEVCQEDSGSRLDVYLSRTGLGLSRNQIQRLLEHNHIRVNGELKKASYRLLQGEQIAMSLPLPATAEIEPEPLSLDILFEDEALIAVNKPPGLVVHPGAGNRQGTLVHGLLHHCDRLAGLGGPFRPGIVHRLDKDTSGVLIAAKSDHAFRHLTNQFQEHQIHKEYSALVHGRLGQLSGDIAAPIYRHPKNRKKMAIVRSGREAATSWWLELRFAEVSLVKVVIKTGRTHQIRVHFAHIHHPVVGDGTYGGKRRIRTVQNSLLRARLSKVKRQMLHARRLVLKHPCSSEMLDLSAPLPDDFASVLRFLKEHYAVA